MANIIIPGTAKNDKDCKDWCPLKDGTGQEILSTAI